MIVTALQILFSLIRYVTETKFLPVFFSDSEDEPADPNIIYEEPDDEASSSEKDVSDAGKNHFFDFSFLRSGGTKERCFISVQSGYRPPHAPTVRLPRNREGGPGARASWVGV